MCRSSVSKDQWATLEGKFQLSTLPDRIVFYLEGPSPGVDLLIESIVISCPHTIKSEVSIFSICKLSDLFECDDCYQIAKYDHVPVKRTGSVRFLTKWMARND